MQRSFMKKIRKQMSMTQSQISKEIGISRSYLTHIENGRHDPSLEIAQKLEKFYGIPITTLLKRDNEE